MRLGGLVVVMLVACGQPPAAPVQPTPASLYQDPGLLKGDQAFVTGRLMLDGAPVPYYGVGVMNKASHYVFEVPVPETVRSVDGRFVLLHAPGSFDLVFVGPGFARHVELDRTLSTGRNDLGDIAVKRGFLVEGRVTDAIGRPVDGATVEIVQSPTSPTKGLQGLLAGNHQTTTDRAGYYWFAGVVAVEPHISPRVSAREASLGGSRSERVSASHVTINLTLKPLGNLVVLAQTALDGQPVSIVDMPPSKLWRGTITDHRFAIDVPEGDYRVHVRGSPTSSQQVTVLGHRVVTATFP